MKLFFAILSMISAFTSAYLMFFKKEIVVINPRDINLILGFGMMLIGIIFISFMLYEEKQEELNKLRYPWLNKK